MSSEGHLAILNWLSVANHTSQQQNAAKDRKPKTGQWFLKSTVYREWLGSNGRTLFCPGIPGAGKTIQTSIVIDDLCKRRAQDASIGLAFIYCDYTRGEKTSFGNFYGQSVETTG